MSVADDFGVEPTNDPSVHVLWERWGNEVGMSLVVQDDPPPAALFSPPPGVQEWWDQQVRSGRVHVIQTEWTDQ